MAFTNAGGKFFICTTAKPTDLTQEQFEALVWVEVSNVGSLPESGTNTNVVSYDTLDTDVTQKAKGISDAGSGSLELARLDTDAGQVALRAAAGTKFNYATKRELTDAPSSDYTNTIYYNRGVITGPVHVGGRNEDFILETFTFGNNQKEIVVGPEAQVAIVNSVLPSISGAAAQTGVVLTADVGAWANTDGVTTYAYQWQADDAGNGVFADISGATAATFTAVVGNVGDALRLEITATNGEGTPVVAVSLPTQLQIAA